MTEQNIVEGSGYSVEAAEVVSEAFGAYEDKPPVDDIQRDEKGHWLKGTSGNPSGKPKGVKLFATVLRDLMAYENLDEIDEDSLDLQEKLMLSLIRRADKDNKGLEMLMDRCEGKPVATQKVDLTSNKSPFEGFEVEDAD